MPNFKMKSRFWSVLSRLFDAYKLVKYLFWSSYAQVYRGQMHAYNRYQQFWMLYFIVVNLQFRSEKWPNLNLYNIIIIHLYREGWVSILAPAQKYYTPLILLSAFLWGAIYWRLHEFKCSYRICIIIEIYHLRTKYLKWTCPMKVI